MMIMIVGGEISLKHYFETGKRYSSAQILKRMNLFLLETGNGKELKTETDSVKMLNKYCKTYRKQFKSGGPVYYHLRNYNPKGLICVKKRHTLEKNV